MHNQLPSSCGSIFHDSSPCSLNYFGLCITYCCSLLEEAAYIPAKISLGVINIQNVISYPLNKPPLHSYAAAVGELLHADTHRVVIETSVHVLYENGTCGFYFIT